ncbi:MAG: hypothetical protein ABIJ17_02925 [Patescibacteria group bacterium]
MEKIKKLWMSIILCSLCFFGNWYSMKYVPFEQNGRLIGAVLLILGIFSLGYIIFKLINNEEGA